VGRGMKKMEKNDKKREKERKRKGARISNKPVK
jgi:hypothetical protein